MVDKEEKKLLLVCDPQKPTMLQEETPPKPLPHNARLLDIKQRRSYNYLDPQVIDYMSVVAWIKIELN